MNSSKSILYISISVLFLSVTYLVFTNPSMNYALEVEVAQKELLEQQKEVEKANEQNKKLKQWNMFLTSDVAVDDERYPLVVMRSGYKVLKIGSETALVGWKMDLANTSKQFGYMPTIEFSLTDEDRFILESSTESGRILKESFGSIQGTMTIPVSDLERLSGVTWTIRIDNWIQNEKNLKGKRLERLETLLKDGDKRPNWIDEAFDENPYLIVVPKWGAVEKAIKKDETLGTEQKVTK